MKNCSHHSGINSTPYAAMFGSAPRLGLASSTIPEEILTQLSSEEDLLNVVNQTPPTTSAQSSSNENQSPPTTSAQSSSNQNNQSPQTTSPQSSSNNSVENEPLNAAEPAQEEAPQPRSTAPPQLTHIMSVAVEIHDEPPVLSPAPHELVSKRQATIAKNRKRASEAQAKQADRMVKRTRLVLKDADIEDNVSLPIPNVDRGKGDPRNILGVIVDHDEHDNYTVAVKAGILKNKYTRADFIVGKQRLLTMSDVNTESTVTMREALKDYPSGGQGYKRCSCTGKCDSKRCACFKGNVKCNSRCHGSRTCQNSVVH